MTTRAQAVAEGLHVYTSGRPCREGHTPLRRYVSNGSCVACSRVSNREARKPPALRDAQRDQRLAKRRAYYASSQISYSQRYYQKNKRKRREQARRCAGLPLPTRLEPETCECCGAFSVSALCLDHCHATGKFRGWLCTSCNTSIGKLGDSLAGLERADAYLRLSQ